jgi:hypothetical protein
MATLQIRISNFEHLRTPTLPPPKDGNSVTRNATEWTTYRTRFLIKARQLEEPLMFVDCLGREHSGEPGDYLVQSSDGAWRITPREIFEDVYVPMEQPDPNIPSQSLQGLPSSLMASLQRLNLKDAQAQFVASALSAEDCDSRETELPVGRSFVA